MIEILIKIRKNQTHNHSTQNINVYFRKNEANF